MKILEKIKSLNPFHNEKKTYKDACDILLQNISLNKKNLSNRPENLTAEQWLLILNRISFGLECKKNNTILASKFRTTQREKKIKESFELLEVYIKHL